MRTATPLTASAEARTMADLILPSELEEVRRLARSAGLDPVGVCIALVGVVPEQLDRRAVPGVMGWLRGRL